MEKKVLALLCDGRGAKSRVLRDDFETGQALTTAHGTLMELFDPGCRSGVEDFLEAVRSDSVVLDWELFNPKLPELNGLKFSGSWNGEEILVVGVKTNEDLIEACERLAAEGEGNQDILSAMINTRARLAGLQRHAQDGARAEIFLLQDEIAILQRELVRKQAALQETESRFHLISENTGDVIWILDLASQRFTYVSPSVLRLRGYTPDEVIAAPVELALTSQSFHFILDNLPKRIDAFYLGDKSALISIDEVDQPHKDGSIVHTEVVTTLLPDRQGKVTHILGVTRDVTQRVRAEQALRESEARYRLLVEKMSDGLVTIDEKMRFTYVNDKFCDMVGYTRQELIGRKLSLIMTEEQLKIVKNELVGRRRGRSSIYEVNLRCKDGTAIYVLISGATISHQDDSYAGSLGVFTDITQRKQAEEALREREKLLTNILDILPVGVWIMDETGKLTFGNPAGQRIWAGARYIGPEKFGEYKGWWVESGEPIAPDEWAAARAIHKGETSIGELVEIEAFDGTHRLILNSALPMWNAEQQISGAIVVNEDITERVRTDERIRLQSTALNFAANAIVITDCDGNITWVNPAFTRLTGYSPQEVIGGNPRLLKSNVQDEHFYHNLWETILSGQVWHGEIINRRKDGNLYTEEMTITPVQARAGKITHFIAIKQDITARKRIERDLRQAKEAAEKAHQAEEERRQDAERRQRVAESLGDVITALNSNQTLGQVLDLIALQARQLLGSEGVAIYQLDSKQQVYQAQSTTGLPAGYTAEVTPSPAYIAMSRAVASGQPVLIPDIAQLGSERLKSDAQAAESSWDKRYRSLLALPIVCDGEIYGALLLYYANEHTFSDEECNLALLYADQAALAIENDRLREEAGEIAVVRERNRLARDLHDAVTQTIYSATLVAEALPKVWERDPDEGLRNLHKLRQLVRGALAEMRTLLFELRPAALKTADLEELVIQLGDALTGRTRIQVEAILKGDTEILEDVKIVLYRITQEAFNNIEKHSGATQVTVTLDRAPQQVCLEIMDNGRGFDPAAVKGKHMGLRIMHERAQSIGASLQVDSKPGQGTCIQVVWPGSDEN
jgi:PAS domain S-box-containing protein